MTRIGTGDINWLGLSDANFTDRVTFLDCDYNPMNGALDISRYTGGVERVMVTMEDQRIFNALALKVAIGDADDQIYMISKIALFFRKDQVKLLDNEDTFIIDANNKTLHFMYFGCIYSYDLNDGDLEDYWHALHKFDSVYDINFNWEYDESDSRPGLTINEVKDGSTGDEVRSYKKFIILGDPDRLFNPDMFLDDLAPGSIVKNRLSGKEETVELVEPDINKTYRIITNMGYYTVKGYKVFGGKGQPDIIKTTKSIIRSDIPCPKCNSIVKEDLVWFCQDRKEISLLDFEVSALLKGNGHPITRCGDCYHPFT